MIYQIKRDELDDLKTVFIISFFTSKDYFSHRKGAFYNE